MTEISLVALRNLLVNHFSLEELHTLCFDLGEDVERFAGKTGKEDLSVKIVSHFQHRARLELLDQVGRERPGLYTKYLSVELELDRARVKQDEESRQCREIKFERVVNLPPAKRPHALTAGPADKRHDPMQVHRTAD